ncbi:MAG TPA: hypothetical protein VLB09_06585, partial [Nitrospiria bacterium]|nr:hypothetical protein [Nitrospiria bacterium]
MFRIRAKENPIGNHGVDAGFRHWRVLGLAALLLTLVMSLAGCPSPSVVSEFEREPGLTLEVDSLVLSPFEASAQIRINSADLA